MISSQDIVSSGEYCPLWSKRSGRDITLLPMLGAGALSSQAAVPKMAADLQDPMPFRSIRKEIICTTLEHLGAGPVERVLSLCLKDVSAEAAREIQASAAVGVPFRDGFETVKVDRECGSFGMGRTKRFRKAEKIATKRRRLPGDRKPCIIRARFRSGRCEFS